MTKQSVNIFSDKKKIVDKKGKIYGIYKFTASQNMNWCKKLLYLIKF